LLADFSRPGLLSIVVLGWLLLPGVDMRLQSKRPAESDKHLRQARAFFDQRKFTEAALEARRAIELNRENVDAWKLSGLSLQLSRRFPEAAQEFTAALEIFPRDADLWFFLGRIRYLNRELKAAEEAVRTAIRLKSDHADALTQLGMLLEARHDHAQALKHYEAAIAANRKQSRSETMALVSAGHLLMKLGRLEESLRHFDAAESLNPKSGAIRMSRGRVLERLGRMDEAEQEFQKAVVLGGDGRARNLLERLKSVNVPEKHPAGVPPEASRPVTPIRFRNAAVSAKLDFVLRNSATAHKYQVETMPGGVAALDYNNDGWTDIYFANGADLPSLLKTSSRYWNRLFRNNQDGTFTDVTAVAGVAGEGYSMGVAAGDFNNDGNQDIFVAGVNRNLLLSNRGDGTFSDVTDAAGLAGIDPERGKMWSVAAAWFDYDNDGDLDLFVVNYCKWNTTIDPYCGASLPGFRTYCFPDRFEGLPNQLFRNNGNGTFTDVSAASGIASHIGKGMGTAVADLDDDGRTDIFVANDTVPNFLFRNDGSGGFQEIALRAGVAVTESGEPVSSMGVDFRDYDNDGSPDLVVSALEGETFPLFRNAGRGFFTDETYASRLGLETARRSGWSLGLYDFNNDGFRDLFTVNSHVNDNIELYNEQTYRQPNSIFVNKKDGTFVDASESAGFDSRSRSAHRGCAFADFNNDGRIDVVTTSLNEPSELWLNDSPNQNHWLSVRLTGTRSNRLGLGAMIKLTSASGARQFNHSTTSVGYASSSDRLVHFGLGSDKQVRVLEVRWPSGMVQVLRDLEADRIITIREPPAAQ